jgi:hypothetical protein
MNLSQVYHGGITVFITSFCDTETDGSRDFFPLEFWR